MSDEMFWYGAWCGLVGFMGGVIASAIAFHISETKPR